MPKQRTEQSCFLPGLAEKKTRKFLLHIPQYELEQSGINAKTFNDKPIIYKPNQPATTDRTSIKE